MMLVFVVMSCADRTNDVPASVGMGKADVVAADGTKDSAAWDALCKLQKLGAGCDLCDALGWYHDGVCDGFCPQPDPDCTVAVSAPSPNGTTVPPAASITDSGLHVWTLADRKIVRDGALDATTGSVVLLLYLNAAVWQETSYTSSDGNHLWWSWTGTQWRGPTGDPRATASRGSVYYMSPNGRDSNPGTQASPWASPNHPGLVCGDTILAASGTYSSPNLAITHSVACPSGDDVVWVRCATPFSCRVGAGGQVVIHESYWGVQGWEVDDGNACFAATPPTSTASIGHIAFANNIANGCQGSGIVTYNNGGAGVDYSEVIGNLTYNASQTTGNCDSGISIGGPRNTDEAPGTHIYVAWNISWGNTTTSCLNGQNSDLTGIAFDTWQHFTGRGVLENNLLIGNGGSGFELVNNGSGKGACGSPVLGRYNTAGKNLRMASYNKSQFENSEYAWSFLGTDNCMTIEYNIGYGTTHRLGVTEQALFFGPSDVTPASVLDNNFLYQSATGYGSTYGGQPSTCQAPHSSPTSGYTDAHNVGCSGNSFTVDPAFVSTAIPGAPSCSGSATTLACMAATVSNWTATNPTAAKMGFQTAAPTDPYNTTPFLCNLYRALPSGLVPSRCSD